MIITRLRGRRTPGEVARLRAAIVKADEVFQAVRPFIRAGRTGREIYDFVLAEVDRQGLGTSWSHDYCPIVTVGPTAPPEPGLSHTGGCSLCLFMIGCSTLFGPFRGFDNEGHLS